MTKEHVKQIEKLREYLSSFSGRRLYSQKERAEVSLSITKIIGENKLLEWQELNRLLKAYGLRYYIVEQIDYDKSILSQSRKLKNPYYLRTYWVISEYLSM